MKRVLFFICLLLAVTSSMAQPRSNPSEQVVVLSNSRKHRLVETANPSSVFSLLNQTLSVNVNMSHYESYTIRLTPSNGGDDIVVNTASLPAGQYVVSLLHNNEVVQSVNVVK